jgi:hypothetical protein
MDNERARDRLAALLRRRTAAEVAAAIDAMLAEAKTDPGGRLAVALRAVGVLPPRQ